MYKIYINDSPLVLCSSDEFQNMQHIKKDLSFLYTGNRKRLHNVIDMMEKGNNYSRIILYSDNLKKLWKEFKSIHKKIRAAGGIVHDEKGFLLAIFRKGTWDLPKGKLKKGETIRDCAIREVEEECGVTNIILGKKTGTTYHVYREKGQKVLKKSIWFQMKTDNQQLTPQLEEGIKDAIWVDGDEFLNQYDMYPNIRDILEKFMNLEIGEIKNK